MAASLPSLVVETHTAWVFFVGERVFKAKRPVDLGFLDFRTVEARRRACTEEVTLNRRLSPDVYLGVADVHGPDGGLCEHLVVMRRMPADRRLGSLVAAGADVGGDIDRIADLLVRFHADAAVPDDAATLGSATQVEQRWDDGLRLLAGWPDVVPAEAVDESETLVRRYLRGCRPLFAHRTAAGRVRDGHGDLLADDIFCLPDGPRILDCLEFDRSLRVCDVLADVGFLAMDLEHAGDTAAARRLLDRYAEASGDDWPASLEHHYLAYRAHIRAKVSAIRAQQTTGADREEAVAATRALTDLSLRHLRDGRVRLVIIGGLPGTGKSTVAAEVGARTGWPVLSSDVMRKHLAGLDPTTPAAADLDTGLYAAGPTDATYRELLDQAEQQLTMGCSVIIDASFTDPARREQAVELAERAVADLVAIALVVDPAVALQRIAARRPGSGASDATASVYAGLRDRAVPWPSATEVRADTALEQTLTQVLQCAGVSTRDAARADIV